MSSVTLVELWSFYGGNEAEIAGKGGKRERGLERINVTPLAPISVIPGAWICQRPREEIEQIRLEKTRGEVPCERG